MKAQLLKGWEVWSPGEPFALEVLEDGAGFAAMFTPGVSELTILGAKQEPDGARLVVPVSFRSYDQAQRAGKILADAFAAVRAIDAEPEPLDDCRHERLHARRFSRHELELTVVCEFCEAVFDRRPVTE